jgi:MerR family transcriptional regulator/heat shock protein HspR
MKGRDGSGTGFVAISVVAKRYNVHPQTLRLWEREGLLRPARSQGNTRLYDDETLRRLDVILTLTRDLGVNLAGVEVILNMRSRMEQLTTDFDRLVELVHVEVRGRREENQRQTALVRIGSAALVKREG